MNQMIITGFRTTAWLCGYEEPLTVTGTAVVGTETLILMLPSVEIKVKALYYRLLKISSSKNGSIT